MTSNRTESDYYAFMAFDRANARDVLSHYQNYFTTGPVVELACGPGVFLDLLRENGIECRGVDLDDGMVEECRARGHEVALGDAVDYLRKLGDESVTGLFAAHFLEHLPAPTVQDVYRQAARALAPGGVFVAAVPNAASLSVLRYDFWRDPTHARFYDPLALQFFATEAGLLVLESGANPRNDPGAPPELRPTDVPEGSALGAAINEMVAQSQAELTALVRGRRSRQNAAAVRTIVGRIGHLLGAITEEQQLIRHHLTALQTTYDQLLAELYQPNEVYVVAVKRGDQMQ